MENFFLALADMTRLRLLNILRDGETCVETLTEVLNESQPKISRHLAYLRNAGLVRARREGKWMHYSIIRPTDNGAAIVLEETLNWLSSQSGFRAERDNNSPTRPALKNVARTRSAVTTGTSQSVKSRKKVERETVVVEKYDEPVYEYVGHNEIDEFLL